jgi:hypothetical protein
MFTNLEAPRFENLREVQNSLVQAQASNIGGFAIRQDYMKVIGDYRHKRTQLWKRLDNHKVPAESPIVQELRRTNLPTVGFVPKGNLATPETLNAAIPLDYSDKGQEVKAIVGRIQCEHFALSMAQQQGRPYGNQMNKDTEELILSTLRFLERSLFTGDADVDPLQFNGLIKQMPTEHHVFTADITSTNPDAIHDKLDDICMRSAIRPQSLIEHQPTQIFCSGAGMRLITREIKQLQLFQNVKEISPGVRVPTILTGFGEVELVASPYLADREGPGGDIISFFLVDVNNLEWHGVYPYGGLQNFEPQIFDLSHVVNGLPTLNERMIVIYGTLKALNSGQGIYRLDVTAPSGSRFVE